ncbi:hypothetical protein ACQ4PT_011358 [Festuca glaucescens]
MGQPGMEPLEGKESNGAVPDCNGGAPAPPAKQQQQLEGADALRYANILRSRNKFADALQLYSTVLEKDGTNVDALIGKGICLQAQSLLKQALECFTEAVKVDPSNACALTHCGMIYKDEGHLVEAAEAYQKARTADPSYKAAAEFLAIVLTDLGTSLKLAGNTEDGIQKYCEALEVDSHYAPAYYNLGVVYSEMMQFDVALTCYEKAALERPLYAEAYCNMGVIYKNRGELDAAIACYDRCLTISPNFEIAKNNMAIALTDMGTKMSLTIKPNFSQSLNNLGVVYTVQGKMDAAASMIEKAILANPTYAEAYNNLGVLYRDAGSITLSVQAYERCLQIDPDSRNAGQNRLLAMNYIDEGSDDKLYDAHREWGKRFMKLYAHYTSWDNPKVADRPLVIGYADAKTLRFKDKVLKKGGLWRDIYGIDEKKVASLIREDKVDILVELTGHTATNKLGTMACRPAPIQVTWIGYPNTTGLPAIDYRITDSLADTPNTNQKHVEELARLPESFLCYTPSSEAGPVCPTPAISNGFVTFGSFNNLAKITPKVLQVWARILCAVPNSRLVVKCKPFCCDSIRQKFLTTLEELGLEPLRVDLLPLIHLNHDHMQAYSLMDISLDTFPYAGTTTTCESLYMGVPCVTMAGSVHAHNVGVSLLTKVGLGRLVAKTEDEYVSLALDLASDVYALQDLRMSVRELMIKSPVCDGESFTRGLESAYRTMWRRYCDGDSPALKRLELLADQPGSTKEDLDKTAVKLADPRVQRANAIAEEDNQAPIKVNATPEEGGQPQIIMANGVSSPADSQALIATAQLDQPQIMVNGVSSPHSTSGRCEMNGHSSR